MDITFAHCDICLEKFSSNKRPYILKCSHTFCKECISKSNKCSVCRKEFSSSDQPIENRKLIEAIENKEILDKEKNDIKNKLAELEKIKSVDEHSIKFLDDMFSDLKAIEGNVMYPNRNEFCINHLDKLAIAYNLHTNEFLCTICSALSRNMYHDVKIIKTEDMKCLKSLQDQFIEFIHFLINSYKKNQEKVKIKSFELLKNFDEKRIEMNKLIDNEIQKLEDLKISLDITKNDLKDSFTNLDFKIESWRENILDQYLNFYASMNMNSDLKTIERISKSLTQSESKIELLERFDNKEDFLIPFTKELNDFIFENSNKSENSSNNYLIGKNKMKEDLDSFFNSMLKTLNSEYNDNYKIINTSFKNAITLREIVDTNTIKNKFDNSLDKIEQVCTIEFENLLRKIKDYQL